MAFIDNYKNNEDRIVGSQGSPLVAERIGQYDVDLIGIREAGTKLGETRNYLHVWAGSKMSPLQCRLFTEKWYPLTSVNAVKNRDRLERFYRDQVCSQSYLIYFNPYTGLDQYLSTDHKRVCKGYRNGLTLGTRLYLRDNEIKVCRGSLAEILMIPHLPALKATDIDRYRTARIQHSLEIGDPVHMRDIEIECSLLKDRLQDDVAVGEILDISLKKALGASLVAYHLDTQLGRHIGNRPRSKRGGSKAREKNNNPRPSKR